MHDSDDVAVSPRQPLRTATTKVSALAVRHRWDIALAALVVVVVWLYGLMPRGRVFPLSTITFTNGWVHCLNDGLLPCPYVGYPIGIRMSIGMPHYVGTFLLGKVGLGPPSALNLLAAISIAAGAIALAWLVHRLGGSRLAGIIAVGLFYLSPAVYSQRGLLTLYFAFALLPIPVAAAVEALASAAEGRRRRSVVASAVTFLAALLVIYSDPYGWAVAVVIGGSAAFAVVVRAVVRRRWTVFGLAAGTGAALLLPSAVFAATVGADATATMPRDFHRAMGVDLAVMFTPTPRTWFNEVLRLPVDTWDSTQFYGDGTNLNTFFGLFTLAAGIAGLVILVRRRWFLRPVAIGFMLGGLVCLLLGLGPSLKVYDTAAEPVAPDGRFTFTDYLMPADEATLSFPWAPVFGVQPLQSMRATYRWHVGLRLVTAVGAALAITALLRRPATGGFRHGPRLAAGALALVLVLEAGSPALTSQRHTASVQGDMLRAFHHDMDATFANGGVAPFERALLLPASNDFLVMDIAPRYRFYALNIAFDKEVARIRPLQPDIVERTIRYFGDRKLEPSMICELFAQDLVDVVVFTNFDLRWNSYSWPPSEESVEAQRRANAEAGIFEYTGPSSPDLDGSTSDQPIFDVEHRPFASMVRLSSTARDRQSCGTA